MGKGGLNRVLLAQSDLTSPQEATIAAEDARAQHIRTFLATPSTTSFTLRIALEHSYLHDAAPTTVLPDGSIRIELPAADRRPAPSAPPVLLLIAMQRPKVAARILSAASSLGVEALVFVNAEKVEKTYWDSKLFRHESQGDLEQNGNPKGGFKDAEMNNRDASSTLEPNQRSESLQSEKEPTHDHKPLKRPKTTIATPVHTLPQIRRRLQEGIEQAAHDTSLPSVFIQPYDLQAALESSSEEYGPRAPSRIDWPRMVSHPPRDKSYTSGSITKVVGGSKKKGAVLAIGPEGGWTDKELELLEETGFMRVSLGERVLRSETAVIVALGLVHEGLRAAEDVAQAPDSANG